MTPRWERLLQSPLFAPLHPFILKLDAHGFPTLEELNSFLASRRPPIRVHSGCGLSFVEQQRGRLAFEEQYEPRCYLVGEVQTRRDNWHDLFNALVWLAFPKSKAAINFRHYRALTDKKPAEPSGSERGVVRDTNTLLDESGVIIACADEELAGFLTGFRWIELFWQRRASVQNHMGFYLFGHGLYEKALQPYVGMTGQGLLFIVEPEFFGLPYEAQLARLDARLADYLSAPENCLSTSELSPVPLLGVPGWTADNECTAYYENTAYFRAGRRCGR